ncbi:hypothetical protein ACFQU7_13340 [Pseudoroseomonas wenyumeiae]
MLVDTSLPYGAAPPDAVPPASPAPTCRCPMPFPAPWRRSARAPRTRWP